MISYENVIKIIQNSCDNLHEGELIKEFSNGGEPEYGKLDMRKDEILNMYPSIKKAEKLLNWKPKTSIKKGLKKTIKFYLDNKKKFVWIYKVIEFA